jgi:imidazolonepropionase
MRRRADDKANAMTEGSDSDVVWTNLHAATMSDGAQSYGEIRDAAIVVQSGRIAWIGPRRELPPAFRSLDTRDGKGGWMTPGLVDCHTHAVHAGSRSDEFEARLSGVTYEEIARRGGGILSTVRATRAATEPDLAAQSRARVERLMSGGVTTVEIKSGYGLSTESETKMLRVARRLGDELPVRVKTSFLGAHAVPPEFSGRADDYVALCIEEMLPAIVREGLADAVDAFCETIAFSPRQVEALFEAARAAGLAVKLHAEQLSDQGGAALVARYGGLSADHIEYLDEAGVAAMATAGTVGVLLPGAFYFLRETKVPPIAELRRHGVPMAVATDSNPGTSPMLSMTQAMNMACVLFRLTSQEALAGATINAARALGIAHETGSLEVGKAADMVLWDIARPADLSYAITPQQPTVRIVAGRVA